MRRELDIVCELARQAGQLAERFFIAWHGDEQGQQPSSRSGALPVEWKAGDEPVTAADRAVSDLAVDRLRREFPQDAVLSEEIPDDGARKRTLRTWLVDPIDGTKDFIAGRSGYSVMIGLLVDGLPTLGVVYQPALRRLYYASRGEGAFLVEGPGSGAPPRRLRVSAQTELGLARMVSSASVREKVVAEVKKRAGIRDEVQIGSVGIKLSLIAAGERDLYINPSGYTKLWDTCAPSIILHEAGGVLTDLYGEALDYRGELSHAHGLVASNGFLHQAALAQLRPFAPLRTKSGTSL